MSVHVCGGGMVEVCRRPDRVRWCFGCRARLPHDWIVGDYPPEHPSFGYFEPISRLDCARCHQDRTTFPGYAR